MSSKTNALRLCEKMGVDYELFSYPVIEGFLDGEHVAGVIGKSFDEVFKTLVTFGKSGNIYVFVIPVSKQLNLKRAAEAVGEKNVNFLPVKDLLNKTGYVKGGCSPIGMRKRYTTVFDDQINRLSHVVFNAGRIGLQMSVSTEELHLVLSYEVRKIVD